MSILNKQAALKIAKKLGELGMMAMAANPVNVIAMAPPLIRTVRDRGRTDGLTLIDAPPSAGKLNAAAAPNGSSA